MSFVAIVSSCVASVKAGKGGAISIVAGGVTGILLACALVWIEWVVLQRIVELASKTSARRETFVTLGALAFMFVWFIAGCIAGGALGSLVAKGHV